MCWEVSDPYFPALELPLVPSTPGFWRKGFCSCAAAAPASPVPGDGKHHVALLVQRGYVNQTTVLRTE